MSHWKKNKTNSYALKWIVYMATEGFGHLKYNVKFILEISSVMRGEALNSSLDHSSDPPAWGRLRAPLDVPVSLGDRQGKAVTSPSCCLLCGVMQWHPSLPNACTWFYSAQGTPSVKNQKSHNRKRAEVAACSVNISKWLLCQVVPLLVSSGVWMCGHYHIGCACHSHVQLSLSFYRKNMVQMILHLPVPNWKYNRSVLRPQF